jgi:hypothetical protein
MWSKPPAVLPEQKRYSGYGCGAAMIHAVKNNDIKAKNQYMSALAFQFDSPLWTRIRDMRVYRHEVNSIYLY